MSESEKMLKGEKYYPDDEFLFNKRAEARKLVFEFNNELESKKREIVLKKLLGKMGKDCFITPSFNCDYGFNIELGENVYMNFNCVILDCCKVKIGDNTLIGPNVQIYTPIHPLDVEERNSKIEYAKPITIGKNCWIGGSVIILAGVSIGEGVVVGAGSVVTKDIPNNVVAVGNPCKVVRQII